MPRITGPAGQPGASIVLESPTVPGCGMTDDERRTIAEMMAKGSCAHIILATADLDCTLRAAAGRCARGRGSRDLARLHLFAIVVV